MKNLHEELIIVISDLIKINNDRFDCYKNLVNEKTVLSIGLLKIFKHKARRIKNNVEELKGLLECFGVDLSQHIIAPGKIFEVWNETKYEWKHRDQKEVMNFCDCGEEAAVEAYKAALISESLNDYSCRNLIMDQKFYLQSSNSQVKKYSDLQELIA